MHLGERAVARTLWYGTDEHIHPLTDAVVFVRTIKLIKLLDLALLFRSNL